MQKILNQVAKPARPPGLVSEGFYILDGTHLTAKVVLLCLIKEP